MSRDNPMSENLRETEMLAALDSIGVRWMPDAEAGEGYASWITVTEPHGEEPADSLADALATMLRASEHDGKRAMVDRLRRVLSEHWLTEVECHHEAKTDTAHCYCTVWASGALSSVGAAVDAWIAHVVEEVQK
jgi:hypothetical protein